MTLSTSRLWAALTAAIVVGGCAGTPKDLGQSSVDALLDERGVPVQHADRELLSTLLVQPVSAATAVRIALINNPAIAAEYARLGFGAADVYEAGRIRNPVFSAASLDPETPGERDLLTFGIAASFTDLITLPARRRLSQTAFAALQQDIGAHILQLASDVEAAWYEYVAAQQIAALREQVAKAGHVRAALAERFRDAGNLSRRELAIERAAASQARLAALDAEAGALRARMRLAGLLGLSTGADWQTTRQLALPAHHEADLDTLLRLADGSRLDLAAARSNADWRAGQVGVVNWQRWLGELDVGVERERETDGERLEGPTLEWEVPLFSRHRDAWLRADAELKLAVLQVKRTAIDVDNAVRLAYGNVELARRRIAEFRDGLIPQRAEIVARGQEQQNYMLIGVFELIELKQDEYDTYAAYLEAVRDYWLARVELTQAVGRALPGAPSGGNVTIDELLQPPAADEHHHQHGESR